MKNKLIKEKRLLKLGFSERVDPNLPGREFSLDQFRVIIHDDDKENPQITVTVHGVTIIFPGAYTMKDLQDLMFFFYGETRYGELFAHLPVKIVKVKRSRKDELMEAFDEGFQSADPKMGDHQITSAKWYADKYETKKK
jgi:hypothetical protein